MRKTERGPVLVVVSTRREAKAYRKMLHRKGYKRGTYTVIVDKCTLKMGGE